MRKIGCCVCLVLAAGAAGQEDLLREAARLDAEGKCAESERIYQRAIAAGTPSTALLNNLGNHYLACGDPEKAERYFKQLVQAAPTHPNANLQLARLAVERREGRQALAYLDYVKDASPAVQLLRAEALHWAGRRDEAAKILAGFKNETDPRVQYTLGVTCARLGLYSRAEEAFRAVLVKIPDNTDVLLNFGRAAARAEHFDRARAALEAVLKARPEDPDVLFELGLVEASRKDYTRAVYLLAQAKQRAPKRADIVLALARAAEEAGFYGDSALAYDEYVRLRPKDDAARRDRGRVYGYTETRADEGRKELTWYVRKRPNDPAGHYYLAQLTWEAEPERSLASLETALKLDPEYGPAHLSIGWLLLRLGRPEEAVKHLEEAVRIMPNHLRSLDQLATAYMALERHAEAEKALRKALAIGPEDPEAALHLGRALMELGKDEEAQEFLAKYRQLRPRRYRVPRKDPGMIELATLPAGERRKREIERFRQMAASRPDDPKLQLHLAGLLLEDGQEEQAEAEYRKLFEMNADALIWEEAGRTLLRADRHSLAREFLERANDRVDLALALLFTEGPEQALAKMDEAPPEGRDGEFFVMKARILDAAGRREDAEEALREALRQERLDPNVVEGAAFILLRYGRETEALAVLDKAPDTAGLRLTRAVILALTNRNEDAEKTLAEIEARWPEWDRAYLAHALLLERRNRKAEAKRKIETAIALGSQELAARCALSRLAGRPPPEKGCECVNNLESWVFPSCEVEPR